MYGVSPAAFRHIPGAFFLRIMRPERNLTTELHAVPRIRMSGAVHSLSRMPPRGAKSIPEILLYCMELILIQLLL